MFSSMMQNIINYYAGKGSSNKLLVFSFHDIYATDSLFNQTSEEYKLFSKKIKWINRYFDVVPLDKGVELCRSGKLTRATACLTFDDGYVSHSKLVLPLMKELGINASFFISSNHLGHNLLWNDILYLFYKRSTEAQWQQISKKIYQMSNKEQSKVNANYFDTEKQLKYLTLEQRDVIMNNINELIDVCLDDRRMLIEEEIVELDRQEMTCGSHTLNHPILKEETKLNAEKEIAEDLNVLKNILNKPTQSFAYPNGKPKHDYDETHVNILSNVGVRYAVTTSPGHFLAGSDPLQIPRVSLVGNNGLQFLQCVVSNYKFLGDFVECRGYEKNN